MEFPAHQLSMTVLMTPDTANFSGKVHGGTILKLLDQVAYACASRYGVAPIKPDTVRPNGLGCTAVVISSASPYAGATRCNH